MNALSNVTLAALCLTALTHVAGCVGEVAGGSPDDAEEVATGTSEQPLASVWVAPSSPTAFATRGAYPNETRLSIYPRWTAGARELDGDVTTWAQALALAFSLYTSEVHFIDLADVHVVRDGVVSDEAYVVTVSDFDTVLARAEVRTPWATLALPPGVRANEIEIQPLARGAQIRVAEVDVWGRR
jgi:hypothetical protein